MSKKLRTWLLESEIENEDIMLICIYYLDPIILQTWQQENKVFFVIQLARKCKWIQAFDIKLYRLKKR